MEDLADGEEVTLADIDMDQSVFLDFGPPPINSCPQPPEAHSEFYSPTVHNANQYFNFSQPTTIVLGQPQPAHSYQSYQPQSTSYYQQPQQQQQPIQQQPAHQHYSHPANNIDCYYSPTLQQQQLEPAAPGSATLNTPLVELGPPPGYYQATFGADYSSPSYYFPPPPYSQAAADPQPPSFFPFPVGHSPTYVEPQQQPQPLPALPQPEQQQQPLDQQQQQQLNQQLDHHNNHQQHQQQLNQLNHQQLDFLGNNHQLNQHAQCQQQQQQPPAIRTGCAGQRALHPGEPGGQPAPPGAHLLARPASRLSGRGEWRAARSPLGGVGGHPAPPEATVSSSKLKRLPGAHQQQRDGHAGHLPLAPPARSPPLGRPPGQRPPLVAPGALGASSSSSSVAQRSQLQAPMTRRKNVTRATTSLLRKWLEDNNKNPYPSKSEKMMLTMVTKMSLAQVSTWFANARRRMKKENKLLAWALQRPGGCSHQLHEALNQQQQQQHHQQEQDKRQSWYFRSLVEMAAAASTSSSSSTAAPATTSSGASSSSSSSSAGGGNGRHRMGVGCRRPRAGGERRRLVVARPPPLLLYPHPHPNLHPNQQQQPHQRYPADSEPERAESPSTTCGAREAD